ncbi:uracil-DNA glycosylase family protein [Capnocytophaga stomatis]|uniref:Uracil-DNA glycosylase family protein n=1 Tax=Capnocytophaga stomatis TaxID=1848904 RepID=A0ABW8QC95_9FLAO
MSEKFLHAHPYPPFIPEGTTKLIVGTLPPPRFSGYGLLKPDDVDFCYGSRDGQLWKILGIIFQTDFLFENTQEAVHQRKKFLSENKIGICDIIESCRRTKIDASDLGMQDVVLRDFFRYLEAFPSIEMLLFTGGSSQNSPEYFFRKYLRGKGITMELLSEETPRIHEFSFHERIIKTVSLTAPSGSANRAVGSIPLYKKLKKQHPNFSTIDFRVMQYEAFFK